MAKERLNRPPCWRQAGEPKGRMWLLRVLWWVCMSRSFTGPCHHSPSVPHSRLITSSSSSFCHLHLPTQAYHYSKWLWLLLLLRIWPGQYRQVPRGSHKKAVHSYWLWLALYLCGKPEPIPISGPWSELGTSLSLGYFGEYVLAWVKQGSTKKITTLRITLSKKSSYLPYANSAIWLQLKELGLVFF